MVHPKTYGYIKKKILILICLYFSFYINADSFNFNTYNNHGVIGLINMPTARFYDEAAHGITVYDGTPPQKITLTSNPYDWLEASFFIPIFKENHIQDLNIKTLKIKVLTLS